MGCRQGLRLLAFLWSFVYCGTSRICWLHMCYAIIVTSTAVLGWCHVRSKATSGYPVHLFYFPLPPRQLKWGINHLVPCRSQEKKKLKARESNGAVVTIHLPMPNYMNDNMT
ncbi:hypothetical protein BC827DRAFT_1188068 [Russula dissimulans]|nr:hypothetical protein BC827DRAFT_1188068 [Russula dissimulans]